MSTDTNICELHNKKLKFACSTCQYKLICSNCVQTTHSGHTIGEQSSIINEKIKNFSNSIQEKYNNMQKCVDAINSTHKSEKEVRAYFNDLYQFIKEEEERAVETLTNERKNLENGLLSLYSRIDELYSTQLKLSNSLKKSSTISSPDSSTEETKPLSTSTSTLKEISDKPLNQIDSVQQLIEKLKSVNTFNEFIQNSSNPSFSSDSITIEDIPDLKAESIVNIANAAVKLNKDTITRIKQDITKSYEFENLDSFQDEKNIITSNSVAYNLVTLYAFVDYKPGFFALHSYDFEEKKWVAHHPTSEWFHKLLAVGNDVLAFDGKRGLFKFDHANKVWGEAIYFEKQERFSMDAAICTDGARYVYIVGGTYGEHNLLWKYRSETSVVRFDITNNTFQEMGQLRWPKFRAHSVLVDNSLIIIDSTAEKPSQTTIVQFALEDGSSKIVFKGKLDSEIKSICYDCDNRNVYIICEYSFYRWSVDTFKLEKLVLYYTASTIFFGYRNGRSKIFAFGTDSKVNEFKCYDIKKNEWETYAQRDSLDFVDRAVPIYTSNTLVAPPISTESTTDAPTTANDSEINLTDSSTTTPTTSSS